MGFWAVDVDQDMLMSELQTMPGVMTIEPKCVRFSSLSPDRVCGLREHTPLEALDCV